MNPSEKGEGKLGSIIWLVIVAAIAYSTWNVAPVYIANYSFADKLNQLARAPRWNHTDERIMDLVMKSVVEEKLERYVTRQSCQVRTMDIRRTIVCEYERTANILPGFKHTFHFKNEADQPLI